ncbi:uncharacterized protein [Dendrobates tinctorius]|uniref:uncharacterized protein n=1 Tax=Dendrobates tinctorius TaxID=92724 RepID=UPI003CC96E72
MADKQDFLRDFFDMYHSMPCLWKIKSADYSNRMKKKEAYPKLVELSKKHYPNEAVDEAVIKKRIQGLRTVYRKELNKAENSSKSGAGSEDVYVPKLCYFDLLAFTRDQEVPRKMTSMLAPDPVIQLDSPVGDDTEEAVITPPSLTHEEDSMATVQEEEIVEPPSSSVLRRLTFSGRKRKAPTSATPEFLELATKVLTTPQNQPQSTGFAYYANEKLPTLDPIQRVHVERVMLEALSQAATGKLTDTSGVMDKHHYPLYSWPHNPLETTMRRGRDPQQNPSLVPPPFFYTPPRQHGNDNETYYHQL